MQIIWPYAVWSVHLRQEASWKSAFEQGPSWLAPNFEGHSLKQTNKADTEWVPHLS